VRLKLLALATLTALIVLLNAYRLGAEAELIRSPAAPHGVSSPSAYRVARAHGQPIAILRRATALRAAPSHAAARLAELGLRTQFGTPRVLAATRERRGWLRVLSEQLPNGRTGWIPSSSAIVVASPWSVRADLSTRTVEVRRDGRVVRRFPVAIGKPSTPTPTGRFAVTDKLRIRGQSAAYGCCALALSGHQPYIEPGWRGGDRMAIHGTGDPGSIGTAASFGCLRAGEDDVHWLINHVLLGSLVEIRD
jgi:lipoprotein-anchoring transpeptidase ErfK/SrfK